MTQVGFDYDLREAMDQGNIFERLFHKSRLRFWLSIIDYKKKKVLDIGCNTGILLIPLLERKIDVIGVDIVKEDIAKARQNLATKKISVRKARVANAEKLPFRTNFFDIVLMSDVLEHVGNPALAAKEAIRVTKPGGVILATVPNEWHPVVKYPWVRKLLSGREDIDEHLDVPFNKQKLTKLFKKTRTVETRLIGLYSEIFGKFEK